MDGSVLELLRNHFMAEFREYWPQLKICGLNLADGYAVAIEHSQHWPPPAVQARWAHRTTIPLVYIRTENDRLVMQASRVYNTPYLFTTTSPLDSASYCDEHEIEAFKRRLFANLVVMMCSLYGIDWSTDQLFWLD